jgi:type IV pilus assembly protein PilE
MNLMMTAMDQNRQSRRSGGLRNGRGFTLVELMVVAVIVAVLASVAVPLMGGGRKRAMVSEAQAALGMARSCLRAMYAETRDYSRTPNGDTLSAGDPMTSIPGVSTGSLAGKYFSESDYTIQEISTRTYVLKCQGSAGDVAGVVITLDQSGAMSVTGL